MTVPMPVRFLALPSLVGVLVMFVIDMHVVVHKLCMLMGQHLGVFLRPQHRCHRRSTESADGHGDEGDLQPVPRADPARRRIGDEPTGMRQGELGEKQCGPILGM